MTPRTNTFIERLPVYLIALLSVGIVYFIVASIQTKNSTGTLTVTTFNKSATVSVSQLNKNAAVIGTGTANARLTPGSYLVAASANGHISTGQVTITARQHSKLNLPYNQPAPIQSSDNINFSGFDELAIHGLNDTQLSNVKKLFFKYKKDAKLVNIDKGSVMRPYRDPDSDTPYTLNFTGLVDSQAFKATITYTNIQDVELTLFDPQTGSQLFDISSQQSAPTS